MKVHSNYPNHPPPSREKFKTLASMKKMCTKVIIKVSKTFNMIVL